MTTFKRSIAIAIHDPGTDRVLIVQRPDDDEDLPGVWGLPAGSLLAGESWADAVARAGRHKLGVAVQPGPLLGTGSAERRTYTLEMRLYDAVITGGEPSTPQADETVTQYQSWRWGTAEDLRPAAKRGSLCSRLYLRSGTAGGSDCARQTGARGARRH